MTTTPPVIWIEHIFALIGIATVAVRLFEAWPTGEPEGDDSHE